MRHNIDMYWIWIALILFICVPSLVFRLVGSVCLFVWLQKHAWLRYIIHTCSHNDQKKNIKIFTHKFLVLLISFLFHFHSEGGSVFFLRYFAIRFESIHVLRELDSLQCIAYNNFTITQQSMPWNVCPISCILLSFYPPSTRPNQQHPKAFSDLCMFTHRCTFRNDFYHILELVYL